MTSERESELVSIESLLLNCNIFENQLKGNDYYYDATEDSDEVEIKTIRRDSILKCDCCLRIPEVFDNTKLINDFKSLVLSGVDYGVDNEVLIDSLKSIVEKANISKIPIEIESSGVLMCAKIDSSNLLIKYNELEDYEDEELTALVRVTNNGMLPSEKAYYDPLKDYLMLNRRIRKSIKDDNALKPIAPGLEYKRVEVIAIYQ